MARERIGIMGGTFNPVHQGHIDMARAAAAQEKLSRVLFLPTGNPPHKREGLVDAEDRYRMAAAAIAQDDVLTPSRLEIDRTGVIYTVDTLTLLREKYPRAQLYFIIGMDTLLASDQGAVQPVIGFQAQYRLQPFFRFDLHIRPDGGLIPYGMTDHRDPCCRADQSVAVEADLRRKGLDSQAAGVGGKHTAGLLPAEI